MSTAVAVTALKYAALFAQAWEWGHDFARLRVAAVLVDAGDHPRLVFVVVTIY